MQHSPSWESETFSAGQEILYILWNLKTVPVLKKAYAWCLS
jgi:hypothetical protein